MPDWALTIAIVAIAISIISLLWNWRHSESLFRRREYPAVAWYVPKVSKEGHNTVITASICNYGSKDISERFGGLFYNNGWRNKGRPKRYKIIFRLEYQPLIADTPHLVRKAYYLIKPVIQNSTIESWELKPIPTWQSWLPWF